MHCPLSTALICDCVVSLIVLALRPAYCRYVVISICSVWDAVVCVCAVCDMYAVCRMPILYIYRMSSPGSYSYYGIYPYYSLFQFVFYYRSLVSGDSFVF